MTTLSKLKKFLLFLAALLLVGIGAHRAITTVSQNKAGQSIKAIVPNLSFKIENNYTEVDQLIQIKQLAPKLSHRDAAIYYRNLTKLYMLRADADNALITFVDAQINAEISKAYDVVAWLFADAAQIYIDFYTFDLAKECINTALLYAENQDMGYYFYEYCYVTLAEISARLGEVDEAMGFYEKSLQYDSPDMPEYQSMDLRRELVLANVWLSRGDYQKSSESLKIIGAEIDNMDYPPMDVLWASGIFCPYLELQTKVALAMGDFELALYNMETLVNAGALYGQIGGLMSFLSDVITALSEPNIKMESIVIVDAVEKYTQKLILEYPKAFQNRNVMAGTHIYNSNMATSDVFVQKYKTENFYKMLAQVAVGIILLIAALVLVWQESEKKGRLDGLTGAFSRKYFNQVFTEMNEGSTPFCAIMYDIDYFKQINDGFGHAAGDMVLRDISKKVIAMMDRDARLFRYGGDEFCIIAKNKTLEQSAELAERIRSEVEAIAWPDGLKATLSIGVAYSVKNPGQVMEEVDRNLYSSKEAGRNHVSF